MATKLITENKLAAPIRSGSINAVMETVTNHQCSAIVWPSQGQYTNSEQTEWKYNQGEEGEPILLDAFTAGVILSVYENVNEDNKAKLARMLAGGPVQFMRVATFALSQLSKAA